MAALEARVGPVGEGWGNAGKRDLERVDPSLNSGKHRLQSFPSSESKGTPKTPATEARARVRNQKHQLQAKWPSFWFIPEFGSDPGLTMTERPWAKHLNFAESCFPVCKWGKDTSLCVAGRIKRYHLRCTACAHSRHSTKCHYFISLWLSTIQGLLTSPNAIIWNTFIPYILTNYFKAGFSSTLSSLSLKKKSLYMFCSAYQRLSVMLTQG